LSVSLHQLVVRKMMLFRPSLIARGVGSLELVTVRSRYVHGSLDLLQVAAEALTADTISSSVIIPTRSLGKTVIGTHDCGHLNGLPPSET